MCIFDIIKKLENIKHNYLIYALEKYTGQITADDIKKRELERQAQDELAKPEVKKPVDEVKKPVDEVKKPVDEVKKPANEVKKFENNIMDSLKWVFISMGILIFLIFIGSLIYWGMYGSNYDEENTMTIENKYIAPPTNQPNQYIAPPINQPNQYIAAPINQSKQYIEPSINQPNQYIEPPNVDDKEKSIFSFLTPFSKKEETSGIDAISKTKTQLDAAEYLESIKQSNKQSNSKTQLDADEYLETIKHSNTKPQLNDKSKTKAQLEADEYLETIKQTITKPQLNNKSNLQSKTKAQLDIDEYLESIKQSNIKPQLDTIKINKDDNVQIQKV
jgi:hypothetical protein